MKKDKMLQIPVDAETHQWVTTSMKEMKIKKQAEFVRMLLTYNKQTDIKELRLQIRKASIEKTLEEAEKNAEQALAEVERLKKQKEQIEA